MVAPLTLSFSAGNNLNIRDFSNTNGLHRVLEKSNDKTDITRDLSKGWSGEVE